MAYVAVTKELVKDINQTMAALCNAEVETLPKLAAETALADPVFREVVNKILWGDLLDLRPRLEKYNRDHYLRIELSVPTGEGVVSNSDVTIVGRRTQWMLPCIHSDRPVYDSLTVTHQQIKEAGGGEIPTLLSWVAFEADRIEINNRWKKITQQVVSFVEAAKSVNEAVKLWPDLRRYLPKTALERLDKKTERAASTASSAADMLAKMDTELVQTSTVVARMAGAKV